MCNIKRLTGKSPAGCCFVSVFFVKRCFVPVEQYLAKLAGQKGLFTDFDEDLRYALVDFVTVFNKEDVRFTFKDGTEIEM